MHTRTAGRPPDTPPPANLADTARRLKAIFVGSSGNLVEWFDFYAYSAFALYFAAAFFPTESQTAQLLNAAAIFAVGFLMRPIGGWLFGHFADRHGRRLALTVSVLLMCAGSLLIAVTPTYDSIGVAAPLHSAVRAPRAGAEPRRRVRHQRHLPVGDRRTPSTAASIRASST